MKYLEINGIKLKDLNFGNDIVPFFTQQIFLKLLEGGSRSATTMIINFVDTYDSWIMEQKSIKKSKILEDNYHEVLEKVVVRVMDSLIMRGTSGLHESLYHVAPLISSHYE